MTELKTPPQPSETKDSAGSQGPSITRTSLRNGIVLALFGLVCTGLIAVTHLITADKIQFEVQAAKARKLNQLISPQEYDNQPFEDCISVHGAELLGEKEAKIYRMRRGPDNVGVFLTSRAADGYSGTINLMIGVYQDGEIAGVRVTEHHETPGLGDKIELKKSNWISQFNQKSLANLATTQWAVKQDGGQFDALTGATITPRAIIKATHKALQYYQQNQTQIFAQAANCGESQ